MAARGCNISEEDLEELEAEAAARRALVGTRPQHAISERAGAGTCSSGTTSVRTCGGGGCSAPGCGAEPAPPVAVRAGDGLTRDEKRAMGAWAQKPGQTAALSRVCHKCKKAEAKVMLQRDPLCVECMETNLMQKTRAVKGQGALSAGDRVAVAVSGGACSLVALRALMGMHAPEGSQRPGKGRLPFGMLAVHVREYSTLRLVQVEAHVHAAGVEAAVRSTGFNGPYYAVELHDVFRQPADAEGRAMRLSRLLQAASHPTGREDLLSHLTAMALQQRRPEQLYTAHPQAASDPTGREDLLSHLTAMALQQAAADHACNKIVLGDSSSRLSARVIAEVAKGRGYAIPGDLHLLDARHTSHGGAAFLRPLAGVSAKEAWMLARARGIQTASPSALPPPPCARAGLGSGASINRLSELFLASLQATVSSTSSKVLRTAQSLEPFVWNTLPGPAHRRGLGGGGGDGGSGGRSCAAQLGDGAVGPDDAPGVDAAGVDVPGVDHGARGRALCALCSCALHPEEIAAAAAAVAASSSGGALGGDSGDEEGRAGRLDGTGGGVVDGICGGGLGGIGDGEGGAGSSGTSQGTDAVRGTDGVRGTDATCAELLHAACCDSCRCQILAPIRASIALEVSPPQAGSSGCVWGGGTASGAGASGAGGREGTHNAIGCAGPGGAEGGAGASGVQAGDSADAAVVAAQRREGALLLGMLPEAVRDGVVRCIRAVQGRR